MTKGSRLGGETWTTLSKFFGFWYLIEESWLMNVYTEYWSECLHSGKFPILVVFYLSSSCRLSDEKKSILDLNEFYDHFTLIWINQNNIFWVLFFIFLIDIVKRMNMELTENTNEELRQERVRQVVLKRLKKHSIGTIMAN